MKSIKISIVIPTYNRCSDLELCIKSILNQALDKKLYEIIIVDNGPSTDDTENMMKKLMNENINIQYHRTVETGCIFARNFGFNIAKGEILLTTDDDIELLSNVVLTKLINTLSSREIGMVGSLELKNNNTSIKLNNAINTENIGRVSRFGIFTTGYENLVGYNKLIEVEHFRSCFMAVRKTIFEEVGGFNEIYNADGMGFRYESDLCLSVKALGHRLVINPELLVWHKGSPRSRGFERGKNKRYLYLTSRNQMFFMLKFFWSKHSYFWFIYDTLIGTRKVPGIINLLRRKELSIQNLNTVIHGKVAGYKMFYLKK